MKELIDHLQQELLMLINKQIFIFQDLKKTKNLWSDDSAVDDGKILSLGTIDDKLSILSSEKEKTARLEAVVAIVGTMKAGKSTTINAIVGEDILPNRNDPMTTIPTLIRHKPLCQEPIFKINPQPVAHLIDAIKSSLEEIMPLEADLNNNALLQKVRLGELVFERMYSGKTDIQNALRDINDVFRLAKMLGVTAVNDCIKEYTDYINLPVIELEFTHSPHEITGGVLSLLDTPGPNEAGQDELLRTCLNEQLKRASITLCVMDYTQLKSEAEEKVRKQIAELQDIFDNRLFVVVNKFDQSNQNSMDAEEVREYAAQLISESLGSDFEENKIFPVAAFPALLATRVERVLRSQAHLPPLADATWIDDFGKRAFGTQWEDYLEDGLEELDRKRIAKACERLFRNALFPDFIEVMVNQSFSKAVLTSLDSASSKLHANYLKLQEFLEVHSVGLSQTKAKLEEAISIAQDACHRIEQSSGKIVGITQQELTNYDDRIRELISIFRKDALNDFNIMFSKKSDLLKAQEEAKKHALQRQIERSRAEKHFGLYINKENYRDEQHAKAQLKGMKSAFDNETLDFGQDEKKASDFVSELNVQITSVIQDFNNAVLAHLQECNQQTRLSLTKIFNETITEVSDELKRKLQSDGYNFEAGFIPDFDFSIDESQQGEARNSQSMLKTKEEKIVTPQKVKVLRQGRLHKVLKFVFRDLRDDYDVVVQNIESEVTSFFVSKRACQDAAISRLEALCKAWIDNARKHFEDELQPIIDEQYKTISRAVKSLQLEFEDTLRKSQQDALSKDKLLQELNVIRNKNSLMRQRLMVVRAGLNDLQRGV